MGPTRFSKFFDRRDGMEYIEDTVQHLQVSASGSQAVDLPMIRHLRRNRLSCGPKISSPYVSSFLPHISPIRLWPVFRPILCLL